MITSQVVRILQYWIDSEIIEKDFILPDSHMIERLRYQDFSLTIYLFRNDLDAVLKKKNSKNRSFFANFQIDDLQRCRA